MLSDQQQAMGEQEIRLLDVALEGDTLHDCEVFDEQVRQSLLDAARGLAAVPSHKVAGLRGQGYALRVQVVAHVDDGGVGVDLDLPLPLVEACARLGLGLMLSNERVGLSTGGGDGSSSLADD